MSGYKKRYFAAVGLFLLASCTPPSSARRTVPGEEWGLGPITSLIQREGKYLKTIPAEELSHHVVTLGKRYHIDPLLILALIRVESNFNTHARSRMGALGLMQIMPSLLRVMGKEVEVTQPHELLDPRKNVLLGVHYLTFLKDRYHQNLHYALTAYNIGPGRVDQLARGQQVGTSFYNKVMQVYRRYQATQGSQVAWFSSLSRYR